MSGRARGAPVTEPFAPTLPLTVTLDVKRPECYLALAPTRALAAELAIAVDWLPIVTSPHRPPPAGDGRGERHLRHRATYNARDIERYAAVQGLAIKDIHRDPDSTAFGMAMLAAKARSEAALNAFLDRAFAAYWRTELDVEDGAALRRLLGEVGVTTFTEDAEAFVALQERLAAAGLFNAPAYLVDDEVFFGRAHLPMIRWLLTDRAGPPPI